MEMEHHVTLGSHHIYNSNRPEAKRRTGTDTNTPPTNKQDNKELIQTTNGWTEETIHGDKIRDKMKSYSRRKNLERKDIPRTGHQHGNGNRNQYPRTLSFTM